MDTFICVSATGCPSARTSAETTRMPSNSVCMVTTVCSSSPTQTGPPVTVKLLHFADESQRRPGSSRLHGPPSGKGRCRLGDVLQHTGLGQATLVVQKKVSGADGEARLCLVVGCPQQTVYHDDGSPLGYKCPDVRFLGFHVRPGEIQCNCKGRQTFLFRAVLRRESLSYTFVG